MEQNSQSQLENLMEKYPEWVGANSLFGAKNEDHFGAIVFAKYVHDKKMGNGGILPKTKETINPNNFLNHVKILLDKENSDQIKQKYAEIIKKSEEMIGRNKMTIENILFFAKLFDDFSIFGQNDAEIITKFENQLLKPQIQQKTEVDEEALINNLLVNVPQKEKPVKEEARKEEKAVSAPLEENFEIPVSEKIGENKEITKEQRPPINLPTQESVEITKKGFKIPEKEEEVLEIPASKPETYETKGDQKEHEVKLPEKTKLTSPILSFGLNKRKRQEKQKVESRKTFKEIYRQIFERTQAAERQKQEEQKKAETKEKTPAKSWGGTVAKVAGGTVIGTGSFLSLLDGGSADSAVLNHFEIIKHILRIIF